ncbi:hypothetical protein SEUCBS139899_008036 [Sporothrix eucalyptigena]
MIPTEYTAFVVVYAFIILPAITTDQRFVRAWRMYPHYNRRRDYRRRQIRRLLMCAILFAIPMWPRWYWVHVRGIHYEVHEPEVLWETGFFGPLRTLFRFLFGWLNNNFTNAGRIETAVDRKALVG